LQTKDTLTLRASSFGSKCEMPDAFLKKVANSGVVDLILSFASFKADKELKKGDLVQTRLGKGSFKGRVEEVEGK
jgi:DNA topoisomerase-2